MNRTLLNPVILLIIFSTTPSLAFWDFWDPFHIFEGHQEIPTVTEKLKTTSDNLVKSELTTGEFNSSFLIVGKVKFTL